MKLPGIEYRQVQSRGRRDINEPLRAAESEIKLIGAVDEVIQTATSSGQDIYNSYIQHQVRSADTEYRLGVEKFKKETGTKEFFDAADLPEDVEVVRTERVNGEDTLRTRIPAWEVYPQLLQKYIQQSSEDRAASITQGRASDTWRQQVELEGAKLVTKAQGKASDDQYEELLKVSSNAVNSYLSSSMWDEAIGAASSYPGTDAERTAIVETTKGKVVTGKQSNELELYYDVLSMEEGSKQLYHINSSIDLLQNENYKGDIKDEDKRFRMVELLKRQRSSLMQHSKDKHNTNVKEVVRDLKQATQANNKGLKVDPKHMHALQDKANALGISGSKEYYDTWASFTESWEVGREVNKFLQNNPLIQRNKLQRRKKQAKTGLELLQYEQFEKASMEYQRDLKTDALSAADRIGLTTLAPIDFTKFSKSLSERASATNLVQDKTGSFTGYLTKDEAVQFSDLLSKAPSEERTALIAQISDGLGPDAYKFYNQLDLKTSAPSFVMAGKLAADGMGIASNLILRGSDVIEKYPTIIRNASIDMDPQIDDALGSAYWHDMTSRAAVKNAVHNIYAALAAEDKDFSGSVIENDDRLEQAIALATGGIATINDIKVEAPRGVSPDVFEQWATHVSKNYFKKHGTPMNFTPGQVAAGVRNGDIELVSTFSRGEYNLLTARDGRLLFGVDEKPYTFSYDAGFTLPVKKPFFEKLNTINSPSILKYSEGQT